MAKSTEAMSIKAIHAELAAVNKQRDALAEKAHTLAALLRVAEGKERVRQVIAELPEDVRQAIKEG
jgi:hypothetical protein